MSIVSENDPKSTRVAPIADAFDAYHKLAEATAEAGRTASFHEQEGARYEEIALGLAEEAKAAKRRLIQAILEATPVELPDVEGWHNATGPLCTARDGDRLYCLLPDDEDGYPGTVEKLVDYVTLTVVDL